MKENIIYILFAILPFISILLIFLFFIKYRQHQKNNLRWLRLIIGNLLLFIFLISILILAGESYYRFFYDTTESFGLTKTTERWFDRYYHRNKSGFRDNIEYYNKPHSGKRRITFIGDSFTVGHGIKDVDNRFVNIIRKMNPDWEVHMLATNGSNTGFHLDIIQNIVKKYKIDQVVLVYNLNDISDIGNEQNVILKNIYESSKPPYLAKNSYLFNMIYFRFLALTNPEIINFFRFTRKAYRDTPIWETQKYDLKKIRDIVQGHGGRLLVVTFPFLHRLGADYEYRQVHQQLDEFWRSLNVPHLDLLELYNNYSSDDLTVNPRDAHPNERAHAMAAKAITGFLEKHVREDISDMGK